VREYLLPLIESYDGWVFSLPEFILSGLAPDKAWITSPAIDPLKEKNQPLATQDASLVLSNLGIDPSRPLVAQVSRFDPWKDPWQAIDAYRLAKQELPGLQLALVGVFSASDDPEGPEIYESVRIYAGGDPDVHLYTDPNLVGEREVNAFQSFPDAVLQRSKREGFGLTVTEAMWKRRPVIATPVGGIKTQIHHGVNGFLVETAAACASHIVELVRRPEVAKTIGEAAHTSVLKSFLMPRLIRDELALYAELLES
jgi:trehalose synthase